MRECGRVGSGRVGECGDGPQEKSCDEKGPGGDSKHKMTWQGPYRVSEYELCVKLQGKCVSQKPTATATHQTGSRSSGPFSKQILKKGKLQDKCAG